MCGIIAAFDPRGGLTRELLADMAAPIKHRGPDDTGLWTDGTLGIGNQRLSIIDLAGGHQPFISDDGLVAVVQNGEIYNYKELAAELAGTPFACRSGSDTEVLLRLYLKEGLGFLSRLNGMFAFAVADRRDHSLTVVRDRVGKKPLYVAEHAGRWLFGSEIKCLLAAGVPAVADPVGLHHALALNYVPPPFTAFQGIRHVAPGGVLRVDARGVHEHAWWKIPTDPEIQGRSDQDWEREILDLLDDATALRLRADVPFGAFLSGGIDSSTVVGLMSRRLERPVATFTIGFPDPRFDESAFALAAAQRFGTDHHAEIVEPDLVDLWPTAIWHCDQPHGDASFMPTHVVSRSAVRWAKMVLTGDGGDELFAGYEKHRDFFAKQPADLSDAEFRRRYGASISVFSPQALASLYTAGQAQQVAGLRTADLLETHFQAASRLDRINQALYLDTALLLPGNNLVKPDRMAMANSLETRSPFLDVRLVELAFRMPGNLKLRDGETKWVLKQAVTPLIGRELAYRTKQMFTVPIGEWFKDRLRPLVEEVLLSERTAQRGWFAPAAVRTLVDEHMTGKANRTRELRLLIAIELWFRMWIDRTYSAPPTWADLGVTRVRG